MAQHYKHTSVTRVAAGSRGIKAVYVVRHKGVVVGRYLTPTAAHRKAKDVDTENASLDLRVQQPFSVGLFRDVPS